jgi:hypothetical protein
MSRNWTVVTHLFWGMDLRKPTVLLLIDLLPESWSRRNARFFVTLHFGKESLDHERKAILVQRLQVAYEVSERRACRALDFPRAGHRYQSVRDDRAKLRIRLRDLAQQQASIWLSTAACAVAAKGLPRERQIGIPAILRRRAGNSRQKASAPQEI